MRVTRYQLGLTQEALIRGNDHVRLQDNAEGLRQLVAGICDLFASLQCDARQLAGERAKRETYSPLNWTPSADDLARSLAENVEIATMAARCLAQGLDEVEDGIDETTQRLLAVKVSPAAKGGKKPEKLSHPIFEPWSDLQLQLEELANRVHQISRIARARYDARSDADEIIGGTRA